MSKMPNTIHSHGGFIRKHFVGEAFVARARVPRNVATPKTTRSDSESAGGYVSIPDGFVQIWGGDIVDLT